MVCWIEIKDFYFSILIIFKFKQYKNANVANLVYYRKTRNQSISKARQNVIQKKCSF